MTEARSASRGRPPEEPTGPSVGVWPVAGLRLHRVPAERAKPPPSAPHTCWATQGRASCSVRAWLWGRAGDGSPRCGAPGLVGARRLLKGPEWLFKSEGMAGPGRQRVRLFRGPASRAAPSPSPRSARELDKVRQQLQEEVRQVSAQLLDERKKRETHEALARRLQKRVLLLTKVGPAPATRRREPQPPTHASPPVAGPRLRLAPVTAAVRGAPALGGGPGAWGAVRPSCWDGSGLHLDLSHPLAQRSPGPTSWGSRQVGPEPQAGAAHRGGGCLQGAPRILLDPSVPSSSQQAPR